MATQAIKDIVVKVGEYTDRQTGEVKGRYENVGTVFQKDDGGTFLAIKRTFNPAGVPNPDGKDLVILSEFDKKPRDGAAAGAGRTNGGGQQQSRQPQQQQKAPPLDDDIPF